MADRSLDDTRRVTPREWIALALLLAPFWWLRLVSPGSVPDIDQFQFHYPTYLFNREQLLSGTFPFWNPYQLGGVPTLATLQAGLLYPPNLLLVALPPHVGMAISGLLHIGLIGASSLVFARRLGLGAAASLLAAMLLCMRGHGAGWINHLTMLQASAWLVPGLLGVLRLHDGELRKGFVQVSVCMALSLLAGFPQLSLYCAYAWLFVALALPLLERRPARQAAACVLVCALAVVLGAVIAGAQLLPALEHSAEAARSRGTLGLDEMFPYGLMGYGRIDRGLHTALVNRGVLPTLPWSFGVVGLLLVPFAFADRRHRTWAIVAALLAIFTMGFAAGPESPLFGLYLVLPELATFRSPMRVLMVTDFCFALLAAIGLGRVLGWLGAGGEPAGSTARAAWASPATLAAVFIVAAAAAEIFTAPGNAVMLPTDPSHPRLRPFHQPPDVLVAVGDRGERFWAWTPADDRQLPWKVASTARRPSISGFNALIGRRQAEYWSYLMWGQLEAQRMTKRGPMKDAFYGRTRVLGPDVETGAAIGRIRLAELAATRHLVVHPAALRDPEVARFLRGDRVERGPTGSDGLRLYTLPQALPRAFVTHTVLAAPAPTELLRRLAEPAFDPRAASYVELQPGVELPRLGGGAAARGERAEIVRDTLHEVEVAAVLASPGLLVLADTFAPGWEASVDGAHAPILATNHMFRGVALPAGEHRVVFRYRAPGFRAGLAASGLGLAVLAGVALYSRSPKW